MMRRGTTPTHTFVLPFGKDMVSAIRVTYAQDGNVVLTKNTEDISLSENSAAVSLTQSETLLFSDQAPVDIQVRVLTMGGDALASTILRRGVEAILDNEVLA